jgi:flagellar L-ring protein precursor FlgH
MKKILALIALVLTGCVHEPPPSKFPALQQQLEKPRPNYAGGSLWQTSSGGLVEDFKARTRGDTVTVVITETASASKTATTSTARTTALSAGVPNFLGLETNMTGIKNWMDLNKLLSADTSSKYDGSGSTTRKENLNATITARVVDVLANGNLLIEGRRNVMVNHEDQIILLEGTVRPKDISPDNIVYSAQIADARITYSGKGIVSDRQQPGWLMNVIDKVWPF